MTQKTSQANSKSGSCSTVRIALKNTTIWSEVDSKKCLHLQVFIFFKKVIYSANIEIKIKT
jgi:hypothetical protein